MNTWLFITISPSVLYLKDDLSLSLKRAISAWDPQNCRKTISFVFFLELRRLHPPPSTRSFHPYWRLLCSWHNVWRNLEHGRALRRGFPCTLNIIGVLTLLCAGLLSNMKIISCWLDFNAGCLKLCHSRPCTLAGLEGLINTDTRISFIKNHPSSTNFSSVCHL